MHIEMKNRENKLDVSGDRKNRTGEWYGKLQAIRQTGKAPDGKYNWLCLCACLGTREVMGVDLDLGTITDCGCGDEKEDEQDEPVTERVCPKNMPMWMTFGQLDLLMLITPGPIGAGMSIIDAAKKLDISYDAANRKLQTFKKRFPRAWGVIAGVRSICSRHRRALIEYSSKNIGPLSFDRLVKKCGNDVVYDMIKDKF